MDKKHIAIVKFNKDEARYELHIDGRLKAYTNWDNVTDQDKELLANLARNKGYEVEYEQEL